MIITNEEFKIHADHLRQCKDREELETRDVARYLNLAPIYISMALNPNSWGSMSRAAKERIIAFSHTRERIQDFKIPEGEVIWTPAVTPEKAKGEEQGAESRKEEAQGRKTEAQEDYLNHCWKNDVKSVKREAEGKKNKAQGKKQGAKEKVLPDKKVEIEILKEKISSEDPAREIVEKYFPERGEKLPAGGNQVFHTEDGQCFRLVLDLEINLIINGRKIQFV